MTSPLIPLLKLILHPLRGPLRLLALLLLLSPLPAPAAEAPKTDGFKAFRFIRLRNIFDPTRMRDPASEGAPPPTTAAPGKAPFFALTGTGPGTPGTRFFDLSQVLRDSYRFVVGANLIWSPVKEFDIGVEAIYTRYGPQKGRILDLGRYPNQNAAYVNNPANPVATAGQVDAIQVRARVQRDF